MEWHTRRTDEIRTMYHVNGYRGPRLGRLHGIAARKNRIDASTIDEESYKTTM